MLTIRIIGAKLKASSLVIAPESEEQSRFQMSVYSRYKGDLTMEKELKFEDGIVFGLKELEPKDPAVYLLRAIDEWTLSDEQIADLIRTAADRVSGIGPENLGFALKDYFGGKAARGQSFQIVIAYSARELLTTMKDDDLHRRTNEEKILDLACWIYCKLEPDHIGIANQLLRFCGEKMDDRLVKRHLRELIGNENPAANPLAEGFTKRKEGAARTYLLADRELRHRELKKDPTQALEALKAYCDTMSNPPTGEEMSEKQHLFACLVIALGGDFREAVKQVANANLSSRLLPDFLPTE